MKLPETITLKVWITCSPTGQVHTFTWDPVGYGWVTLKEVDVVLDVPQEDPTNRLIKALKDEQSKVRAEAEVEANKLEEKIQNLLALPETIE